MEDSMKDIMDGFSTVCNKDAELGKRKERPETAKYLEKVRIDAVNSHRRGAKDEEDSDDE
jgi:hypothetical protein